MATNKDSDSEKNNDDSIPNENEADGLSAEQAGENTYSEAEAWKKSKNTLLLLLGLIAISVAGFTFLDISENEKQSERSYRFLSASIDSEGAEDRFLSFATDYDDSFAGVARYRAAVIQYRDKRYGESSENFKLAAIELKDDPLAGRALLGQAVSLIRGESMKGDEGKKILEILADNEAYLPTDRHEACYLLVLQALAESDKESLTTYRSKLSADENASYFLSRIEELVKTNEFLAEAKSLPEINLSMGNAFLEKNGKRKDVITLKSGLQYKILSEGTGLLPQAEDEVEVHYTGTLINNEVFDSSIDRGEPASFQVGGVIKGWTEALQLMKEGAKWKLFIPSDLAYGESGNNSIGPNETLIFEVELIGITPKEIPEPPSDLNLNDTNSSSAEATLIIPEVDANSTVPVVEEIPTAPADGNGSQ
jgi:FKBP-type peptidyl-prolyl cis-trans isomerase FklB